MSFVVLAIYRIVDGVGVVMCRIMCDFWSNPVGSDSRKSSEKNFGGARMFPGSRIGVNRGVFV